MPDWVPGIGGKGINIPNIPMLAKGGNVIGGGQAIVGEKGAELIDLPPGARVTPLSKQGLPGNEEMADLLNKMYELMCEFMPNINSNYKIVTDTGALIGEIAPGLDVEMGQKLGRKNR